MPRCLISTSSFGKLSSEPLLFLEQHGFRVTLNPFGRKLRKRESLELYGLADVVIAGVEEIDEELLAANPQIKVISRCGIGTDSVDMGAAKARQIPVLITPEPPAQAVAELTLGLIFALARRISESDAAIRRGEWSSLMGVQLKGKTAGIVGLGRVGQKVARVLKVIGLEIIAYDPYPNMQFVEELGVGLGTVDEVLTRADIVCLHVPLLPETRNLLNKELLARMKPDAMVINTSRGGIIDEDALLRALEKGKLRGAALDVFAQEPYMGPLCNMSNVVLTAHMGSYAAEARSAMELEAATNLVTECRRIGMI